MLWKNINYFDWEEMLKMAWYSAVTGFWTCQFQWHRFQGSTFRCFWVMGYMYALSWKLLIIGLLLKYFATFLKILYLKKIARKCSIFLHWLYFFLWEFPLLSKIQTLSHKLLVRQTSNHHHCNWHAQKNCRYRHSSDFEQFFHVKNNFVYF